MDNLKKSKDNNWWQEGIATAYKIGGWIASPIILAIFIGSWLDEKYSTNNKYFYICISVAFVISNIGLILEVLKYNKKIKKIDNQTKKDQ